VQAAQRARVREGGSPLTEVLQVSSGGVRGAAARLIVREECGERRGVRQRRHRRGVAFVTVLRRRGAQVQFRMTPCA